jgi:DNA-binding CsgD family transcriptional regulator
MMMAMLTTTSTVVSALIERGELHAAWDALARVGCADGAVPDMPAFTLVLPVRGRLRLVGGDAKGSLQDFLESERRAAVSDLHNPVLLPWRASAVAAHLIEGNRDAAIALAADELARAQLWGTPGALGAAERLVGVAAGGDEGIEHLQVALELLAESPSRLEHARCLVDLGAALRRANRRAEAREPLRTGAELAERCGATALQRRALDELAATGARLRRVALSGPDSLTASERRVVDLAAEGLTNVEIAQALFVTRKTVEKHLGSAYSKLDITSRAQLPRAISG